MHLLDRNSIPIPDCLSPVDPPRRYRDLRGDDKSSIRRALLAIQRNRCAYCERRTGEGCDDGHIEHFRKQAEHTQLETDWSNLFWSCLDERTCGKHKDKCDRVNGMERYRSFNPDHIIDPCQDDPDRFMNFISDGTICPRGDLSEAEQIRYNETVRVFQLADSAYLRKSREDAVSPYLGALDALRRAGPEIFRSYIIGELALLESTAFATPIRHFLTSNLS